MNKLRAIFIMPHFTTRTDAVDMATPHGLALQTFKRMDDGVRASFTAESRAQIDGLAADLSYGPDEVEAA